jgi:hypothetical protein
MAQKQGPMTAREALSMLERDPEYVAMRNRQEAGMLARAAAMKAEQEELSRDLARVGVHVESAWTLASTRADYAQALPVLLDHVVRPYSDRVRSGIAYALALPTAEPMLDELVTLYREAPSDGEFKVALARAIAEAGKRRHLHRLVELLREKEHGTSRSQLLRPLQRMKGPEIEALLDELIQDPDLEPRISDWRKSQAKRSKRQTKSQGAQLE